MRYLTQNIKKIEANGSILTCRLHQFFRIAGVLYGVFVLIDLTGGGNLEINGPDSLWAVIPTVVHLPVRILRGMAAIGLVAAVLIPFHSSWCTQRSKIRALLRRIQVLIWFLLVFSLANMIHFYILFYTDKIRSTFPIPMSFFVVVILFVNLRRIHVEIKYGERIDKSESSVGMVKVHGICLVTLSFFLPLALLLVYGLTDYAPILRGCNSPDCRADCIIVYGAKVKDDGEPSMALADRVRHAAVLFHGGFGRYLVMSGGVSENGISEPKGMKDLAVSLGVPAECIMLDETGDGTYNSVMNATRIMNERGWRYSLSVSHYYHLLRIKFTALRAGLTTFTVPARMTTRLRNELWYLAREVAAIYYYYFFQWGETLPSSTAVAAAPGIEGDLRAVAQYPLAGNGGVGCRR